MTNLSYAFLVCLLLVLLLRKIRHTQPHDRAAWFVWYSNVYLRSWHWQQHRRLKFFVYGRRCRDCGKTKGAIQLHHENYRHLWHERVIGFRDTTPLCPACHAK